MFFWYNYIYIYFGTKVKMHETRYKTITSEKGCTEYNIKQNKQPKDTRKKEVKHRSNKARTRHRRKTCIKQLNSKTENGFGFEEGSPPKMHAK